VILSFNSQAVSKSFQNGFSKIILVVLSKFKYFELFINGIKNSGEIER
jgi:hypothetical protein